MNMSKNQRLIRLQALKNHLSRFSRLFIENLKNELVEVRKL